MTDTRAVVQIMRVIEQVGEGRGSYRHWDFLSLNCRKRMMARWWDGKMERGGEGALIGVA